MSLIFDVSPNYVSSYLVTYTSDEISITPKLSRPQLFPQLRELLEHFPGRNALHHLYHLCWRTFRGCLYKHVHMIFHYFHRIYVELILLCNMSKHLFQILRYFLTQYMLPVLGYPHQVILQVIYGVLRSSDPHTILISPRQPFQQTLLSPRLSATHFPPASKLAGIQWGIL